MLENVILKGGSGRDGGLVDAGLLAESLIYYGRVRLILNPSTIAGLVHGLGCDLFTELTTGGLLDVTLQRGQSATLSLPTPMGLTIQYAIVDHGAKKGGQLDDQGFIELNLQRASNKAGWSRRLARRLVQKAVRLDMSQPGPCGVAIADAARADLENTPLVQRLVGEVLHFKMPAFTLPYGWYIRLVPHSGGGYIVHSNLDMAQIERIYLQNFPDMKVFGFGDLLGIVAAMHEELFVQCTYSADLQTSPLLSSALRIRIDAAIERATRQRQQLDRFQEALMPNGRCLREAVNAGEVDFRAVLKLHRQRERFSDWVRKQPSDSDLLRAYFDELNHTSLLEHLRPQWKRFLLFAGLPTALGMTILPAHEAVELGLVAKVLADRLYEKLTDGWKPDQFVGKIYNTLNEAQHDRGNTPP
jgi:hypothetical protein